MLKISFDSSDFEKELKKLQDKLKKIEGRREVNFKDLFSNKFMVKHTNFKNIDDFFNKSPFELNNNDDFDSIDSSDLDLYVKSNTYFNSWEDMIDKAADEYIERLLDL